jgi:hypothetical protein
MSDQHRFRTGGSRRIRDCQVVTEVMPDPIPEMVIDQPEATDTHAGKSRNRHTSGQRASMVWAAAVISRQRRLI